MKGRYFLSPLFALILTSAMVSNVLADNAKKIVCTGEYSYASLNDLIVPKGQTCTIGRFNVVNGNIEVKEGANLVVCPDNDIHGNIKADRPNSIFISDQLIGPCAPLSPPPKALGIIIDGDIKVESGNSFTLIGNPAGVVAVKGDVKIERTQTVAIMQFTINGDVNIKHSTDVTVTDNVIGGDLKIKGTSGTCTENNNSVSGKVDSCS